VLTKQLASLLFLLTLPMLILPLTTQAEDLRFTSRTQVPGPSGGPREARETLTTWPAERTALIICDVWDYHHCLNAVRRLEEFAPRMNELVKFARSQGVTIIHAPSDCMAAYENHPARLRAVSLKEPVQVPANIQHWCSRIPAEAQGTYPLDQSDGGEDDDPQQHAEWAAKLKSLGRNPAMPWKAQSSLIDIEGTKDFISDRGDEVWRILASRRIDNVLLVGVHVNMCVLGRPFGLRQMVRNGKNAVLVRDLTDAMYNPQRWPFVDHFTGTDLVISHIETFVCPTTTSDQFLGGQPLRSKFDTRSTTRVMQPSLRYNPELLTKCWQAVAVPNAWPALRVEAAPVAWYRANVWMRKAFADAPVKLSVKAPADEVSVWLNGTLLPRETVANSTVFSLPVSALNLDDANLLVIRLASGEFLPPPSLQGQRSFPMAGRWEVRLGDEPAWSNIPLPAKFGTSPDIVFEP